MRLAFRQTHLYRFVNMSGGFNSDIFVLEALHRNGFEFSKEFRMRLFQIFADAIRTTVRI